VLGKRTFSVHVENRLCLRAILRETGCCFRNCLGPSPRETGFQIAASARKTGPHHTPNRRVWTQRECECKRRSNGVVVVVERVGHHVGLDEIMGTENPVSNSGNSEEKIVLSGSSLEKKNSEKDDER
jgi:hypothetical protein